MTKIRLRPYHPTYIVANFGAGGAPETSRARKGFDGVNDKIKANPCAAEIEIVQCHDDVCEGCTRIFEQESGSVWGERKSCSSAEDPEIVASVNRINARMLKLFGLNFGDRIMLVELAEILSRKLPDIDDDLLGGTQRNEDYHKGLGKLLSYQQ
jgi:hypothetical protein